MRPPKIGPPANSRLLAWFGGNREPRPTPWARGPRWLSCRQQRAVGGEDISGLVIKLKVGALGSKGNGSVAIACGRHIFHQHAVLRNTGGRNVVGGLWKCQWSGGSVSRKGATHPNCGSVARIRLARRKIRPRHHQGVIPRG